MKVSIVVPAYNASATLAACLEACLAQTAAPHEVIVVDDGSTDDTPEIARSFSVRYMRTERAGPASARNLGARAAGGDVVAFTDADCVPEREWLGKLLSGFEDGVAGVGGSYANANTRYRLARLIHEEIEERHRRMNGDVDFLGSFNVAYRRDDFLAAGGFDESFREASGEDNDLAYRLHDAGHRLVFQSGARVAHYHPTRLVPYLRTQMRHGFWRMKLYAKHAGRSRGDRYAGFIDLIAPPMALGAAGMWCLALLFYGAGWPFTRPAVILSAGITTMYMVFRLVLPARLVWRTGKREMLWFLPLAVLRDFARALGLIRGIGWFYLRRKTTV